MAPVQTPGNAHRVRRARFEVSGGREDALLDLRNQIAAAAEDRLPEALAEVLDEAAGPGEVLEIERLEVDLGSFSSERLDVEALARATRRALMRFAPARAGPGDPVPTARSGAEAGDADVPPVIRAPLPEMALIALVAYLQSGRLDGRSPLATLSALFDALEITPETARRLFAVIRGASGPARLAAAMRLVAGSPPSTLHALLAAERPETIRAFGSEAAFEKEVRAALAANPNLVAFAERLVARLMEVSESKEVRAEVEETLPPEIGSVPSSAPESAEEVGIAADNAGVVLLHPFLPRYFKLCGLTDGGRFKGDAEGSVAARLIHYLATGETQAEEPALLIPRTLCAVPAETPLLALGELDSSHLEKGDALLGAAIGHWTKLGKTSIEGLRETFLTRPGLLKGPPERLRLAVEQRGVDVLLGALPWPLDPVRLPWLSAPIAVDWT